MVKHNLHVCGFCHHNNEFDVAFRTLCIDVTLMEKWIFMTFLEHRLNNDVDTDVY